MALRHKISRGIKWAAKGLLLLSFMVYIGLNCLNYATYTGNDPWGVKPKCYNSKFHTDRLIRLAQKTHSILNQMGIEHWLMYGSLWGPLRGIPGPLPWDHDVDFGIKGEGNFSKMPIKDFKARFRAAGFGVADRLKATGSLTLGGAVDIFVFYDYHGYLWRGGYEPWTFYINYRLYHTFPARLLKQPLPKVRFGSFNVSFPRGGMEIVKHLYPFNWWKEVKPVGCEDEYTEPSLIAPPIFEPLITSD